MDLSHNSMGVPTHLRKSCNGSFNGFTDQEIYSNLWEIEHHSLSTTVRVKPEIFDHLTNELLSRYGTPQNHHIDFLLTYILHLHNGLVTQFNGCVCHKIKVKKYKIVVTPVLML